MIITGTVGLGWGAQFIQGPDGDTIGDTQDFTVITLGKSAPGTISVAGVSAFLTWQLNIGCALAGLAATNGWVVPTNPLGMGSVHKTVVRSLRVYIF